MCSRLKPVLYTADSIIIWEGDPVDEMLFIMRGNILTDVEAFCLMPDDLKSVASQFRRLHSKQLQQQWRTCFIQAAWRRYCRRKMERAVKVHDREFEACPSCALPNPAASETI
ncbi:hypothetical protein SASPL_135431 [Salvia splendens]|uniref:Cyclic nucleotide-binding domain-containing protein n=1 Tax=Salvia splendens TaxID=180675 RepID=A0A8X8ZGM7_SALSN|nr:hypothetical protein SASPL_135431 [Salvia splendens]